MAELARADQAPVRITYQAEGACPSERSFREDVESRTLLARQPTGHETRQFIVMVKDQGHQSLGRLVIGDQHGSVVTREVTGESCAEVASALALITALAIDPQASLGERAPLIAEPASPNPFAAPVMPPPFAPAQPPAPEAQSRVASAVQQPRQATWALATERPGPSVRWRWTIGLQGISLLGFGTPAAFGGGVFGDLGPSGRWYIWPAFRLGVAYATTGPWQTTAGVDARWQWLFARAEACPVRLRPGEIDLYLSLCAAFDAGGITSTAPSLVNPTTKTKGWLAPGLEARLSWGLPKVLFELGGELSRPVRQWSYKYVDADQVEHRVARIKPLGVTISLGVGYRFP
jgi:hypothetical protein